MAALHTEKLTKRRGTTTAVDNFTITVESGEVFGFLGPNGAGKSTTIDILLDFIRPTDGHTVISGHDPQESPQEVREDVGVLPDDYTLYDSLTGKEHIELAISMNESEDDPAEILSRVGMADAGDQRAGSYSKGMSQRLALGMALVGDPDVLILDEPSSGIDPNGMRDLRELIHEEADRGTTVFFSTHSLEQVEAVCDRVGIINEGELVAVDTIDGLRESFETQSQLILSVDSAPTTSDVAEIEGVTDVQITNGTVTVQITDPEVKSSVITRIEEAGVTVLDIEIERSTLADLFSRITTGGEIK